MKKTTKILSFIMALAMMITSFSAFGIEAFAASKPNKTSITSVAYSKGETVAKVKKVSYKDSDTAVDYYELQYSEDENFKSGVNTIVSPCSDGTSITIDMPFSTDVTIYFRARTVRKNYKQTLKTVSWSSKKQKVWVLSSTTTSDWTSVYKVYVNWIVDDNPDDGAYDAHVQAQAVIAQVGITDSMSDLEKVARIQNWINNNWYYSQDFDIDPYEFYNYMFYVGKGACNQYAYHFLVFMKELGIPCKIVYREQSLGASTTHVWNIIKINGYWWGYDCESFGNESDKFPGFVGMYNNIANLSDESTTLWENSQPHGEEINTETVNVKFSGFENQTTEYKSRSLAEISIEMYKISQGQEAYIVE